MGSGDRVITGGRRGRSGPFRLALAALCAGALATAELGGAAAISTKLGPGLCETTGGAGIVDIPGFPGEQIDRRLLRDIRLLRRRYPIFITDGYSTDRIHAAKGEHPLGLALDIVPDTAGGGTWRDITALARWAEPGPDDPRTPFRWVGYDGDRGHGRRHHLHLSWNHSATKRGRLPRTVYTLRCPTGAGPAPAPGEPPPEPPPPVSGGTEADPDRPVPETGGVGVG